MRLAMNDEFAIDLGNETIRLRPTLRAAFRLEQKYGGFHNLFNAVASGTLTAFSDVLKEGCGRSTALTEYLDSADGPSLAVNLELLIPQVSDFLFALAGMDGAKAVAAGEPMPFLEYHTKLFGIATGWLLWPPDVAWNATPAEILEAQKGLVEKLHFIHGSKPDVGTGKPGAETRRRLNALGDLTVKTMDQVPS